MPAPLPGEVLKHACETDDNMKEGDEFGEFGFDMQVTFVRYMLMLVESSCLPSADKVLSAGKNMFG